MHASTSKLFFSLALLAGLAAGARADSPDAAGVIAMLKSADAPTRLKGIDACSALGDKAQPAIEELINLLADTRRAALPAGQPTRETFVCNAAVITLRQLGPLSIPALRKDLLASDGNRASLAARALIFVLANDRDDIKACANAYFSVGENFPGTGFSDLSDPQKNELAAASFQIWIQTLRAEKLAHGDRPADGVDLLCLFLDHRYAVLATTVTQETLKNAKEADEWKLLAEQLKKTTPVPHKNGPPEPSPWHNCAMFLAQAGQTKALPTLFELCKKNPANISLVMAIGSIGAPAVDPILEFASAGDYQAKSDASWIMGYMRDPQAVDKLAENIDNTDVKIRSMVATGLRSTKSPRAVKPLADRLINEKDEGMRGTLIVSLADLPFDPRTEKMVITLMQTDPSKDVRRHATRNVFSLCHKWPDAFDALAKVIAEDPAPEVRYVAAQVIYNFAHLPPANRTIPALEKAAEGDAEKYVCDEAASAIKQIRTKAAEGNK